MSRLSSTRSILSGATGPRRSAASRRRLEAHVLRAAPRPRAQRTQLDRRRRRAMRRASSSVSAPASIRASSKRSSTSTERMRTWSRSVGRYSVGVGEAVLDRLEHRLHRGERRAQVVARPGDELAACVEEPLDARRHRVERRAELGELARPACRRPRATDRPRRARRGASRSRSSGREDRAARARAPRATRGGRRAGRDGEDLHVVAHVEHHPARDAARRRAGAARRAARGRRAAAGRVGSSGAAAARGERRSRGVPAATTRASSITARAGSRRPRPSRGGAGATASSSIFSRRRRMWTVTVPVSTRGRVAPDAVHQLVAREDLARVRGEEPEQVELLRGELQQLARRVGPRGVAGVDHERRRTRAAPRSRLGRRAAQHRLDARGELARRERLRHVVVGAELEPDDPVGLLAAGRQQDHGQVRRRPDPAAEREPVGCRAASRRGRRGSAPRVSISCARPSPSLGRQRPEPVPLEIAHDDVADDRLVVDDQTRSSSQQSAAPRRAPDYEFLNSSHPRWVRTAENSAFRRLEGRGVTEIVRAAGPPPA